MQAYVTTGAKSLIINLLSTSELVGVCSRAECWRQTEVCLSLVELNTSTAAAAAACTASITNSDVTDWWWMTSHERKFLNLRKHSDVHTVGLLSLTAPIHGGMARLGWPEVVWLHMEMVYQPTHGHRSKFSHGLTQRSPQQEQQSSCSQPSTAGQD